MNADPYAIAMAQVARMMTSRAILLVVLPSIRAGTSADAILGWLRVARR